MNALCGTMVTLRTYPSGYEAHSTCNKASQDSDTGFVFSFFIFIFFYGFFLPSIHHLFFFFSFCFSLYSFPFPVTYCPHTLSFYLRLSRSSLHYMPHHTYVFLLYIGFSFLFSLLFSFSFLFFPYSIMTLIDAWANELGERGIGGLGGRASLEFCAAYFRCCCRCCCCCLGHAMPCFMRGRYTLTARCVFHKLLE